MLKDLLRYKANAVFVGGVILAVFLLLLGVAFAINRTFTLTFWDKGYEIKADFVDADGIANASDVRISGVYVGQITEIRSVSGGLAEITMRVDKAHTPLHEGTKANLRLQTLLGTKFIELDPGPANNKALETGTVIPANATASPVDFDQLLSSFNKPTRDSLSTLIQEGGIATNGQGENINALLGDLHSLSVQSTPDLQTFADRSDHIDSILRNLDDVSGNLADNRTHLANTFTNLDSVLATIAANDAGLRKFIEQGNIAAGHGLNQFSGEHQNIQSIITQLRPALHALNPELADVTRLDKQFDAFINLSQPFVNDLFSAVHGYNTDAGGTKATTCGSAGCGGFFLRQPTILVGNGCPQPGCLRESSSGAPSGLAQPAAAAGNSTPLTQPTLPQLQSPALPGLLPQQSTVTSTPTPPPPSDAINGLLNYLLGH
ncbi:MAG TPA: MlaD family protein [Candidatus Dormibacteraeota bacterium]|jgi:phospholipid/cholesterol/gamma-HCH transport system substrate-binding protein|nr:MlaD family protein [Candidatus Dormibacteraeota bacterium]